MNAATRRVLREAQPAATGFAGPVAAGVAAAGSSIALLGVSGWLITRAAEQPAVMYLSAAIVAVRALALARGAFRYLERITGHDAALSRLAQVRARLVRRIRPLAPDGLGDARRGRLLSGLVDDVDELQDLPLRVVLPLTTAALTSIGAVAVVGVISPAAAGLLAAGLVVASALAGGAGWAIGARSDATRAALRARLTDRLVEHLTGLDVLIAYDATDASRDRIRGADRALRRATVRMGIAQGAMAGAVTVVAGSAALLTLAVTASAVTAGDLTGPGLTVVVLLPLAVFDVFGTVPLALAAWRRVRTAAERIATAVPARLPEEIPADDAPGVGRAVPLGDGVDLAGLCARWPGAQEDALRSVDLKIRPGERVLLTGASGSGKTTLAHVLVRFLDYRGSYRVGGAQAREWPAEDLRRTIGLCEQHPYLFDESLRQNLLFARDTAGDDDLWEVLARVGLADWAAARGGLDAPLGERGALVSGGQAQRIALARALLADFPFLILDEPAAGVDPAAADALLSDLLGAVGSERSALVISHVPLPDGLVDREVALIDGRVRPAPPRTSSPGEPAHPAATPPA